METRRRFKRMPHRFGLRRQRGVYIVTRNLRENMRTIRKHRGVLILAVGLAILLAGAGWVTASVGGPGKGPASNSTPGADAARTLSLITGVAISPLLGAGAVGAYDYWRTPAESRAGLPWFAQMWFWLPALAVAALAGIKDILGAGAPNALKKPFDLAETLENKLSGLLIGGAFVPLVISVFPQAPGLAPEAFAGAGFAAIQPATLGNALLIPLALAVYFVVWMAAHAINILILISPFTTVDSLLKLFRLSVLSAVTGISLINPYAGAAFSLGLILVCYFLAGWSFRLTVFGTVFGWDLLTRRRRRFQPGGESNLLFTARALEGAPIRAYGRLRLRPGGGLEFSYCRWVFFGERRFALPAGHYVVGRGLLYPEISRREGDRFFPLFALSPRYGGHEETLARVYELEGVVEVGWRRGFQAVWRWLRSLLGASSASVPAPETALSRTA